MRGLGEYDEFTLRIPKDIRALLKTTSHELMIPECDVILLALTLFCSNRALIEAFKLIQYTSRKRRYKGRPVVNLEINEVVCEKY
jgi:hypothetical protein